MENLKIILLLLVSFSCFSDCSASAKEDMDIYSIMIESVDDCEAALSNLETFLNIVPIPVTTGKPAEVTTTAAASTSDISTTDISTTDFPSTTDYEFSSSTTDDYSTTASEDLLADELLDDYEPTFPDDESSKEASDFNRRKSDTLRKALKQHIEFSKQLFEKSDHPEISTPIEILNNLWQDVVDSTLQDINDTLADINFDSKNTTNAVILDEASDRLTSLINYGYRQTNNVLLATNTVLLKRETENTLQSADYTSDILDSLYADAEKKKNSTTVALSVVFGLLIIALIVAAVVAVCFSKKYKTHYSHWGFIKKLNESSGDRENEEGQEMREEHSNSGFDRDV